MKPPAFQFYPDDFLAGTLLMTNGEVGVYIRLLCIQWNKGYVKESDAVAIAKGSLSDGLAIDRVLEKFERSENGELRNPRMESERMKQAEYRKNRSEAGSKGNQIRWHPATPPIVKEMGATIDDPYPWSVPEVKEFALESSQPTDIAAGTGGAVKCAESLSARPHAPKKPRARTERDELFDVLIRVGGVDLPESGQWGDRAGQTAKALQKIKVVVPNVSTGDIHQYELNFKSRFPNATVTPTAIASRISELIGNGKPKERRRRM